MFGVLTCSLFSYSAMLAQRRRSWHRRGAKFACLAILAAVAQKLSTFAGLDKYVRMNRDLPPRPTCCRQAGFNNMQPKKYQQKTGYGLDILDSEGVATTNNLYHSRISSSIPTFLRSWIEMSKWCPLYDLFLKDPRMSRFRQVAKCQGQSCILMPHCKKKSFD